MARISTDLGTALVATFWGLLIAIPSLTVFGILRSRVDILMEETAAELDQLTSRLRVGNLGSKAAAATGRLPAGPAGGSTEPVSGRRAAEVQS